MDAPPGGQGPLYLWRRYGARVIDSFILGESVLLLGGVLIGAFGSDAIYFFVVEEARWKDMLIYTPLMWIASAPLVAALTAWLGATPGKLLLGLRVLAADGGRPTFTAMIRREGELLIWGIGLAIPLVSLAMAIRSYSEVESNGVARWDAHNELVVAARPARGGQLVGIILGGLTVAALLSWGLVSRLIAI